MKPVHIMDQRPPKNYETKPNWTVPVRNAKTLTNQDSDGEEMPSNSGVKISPAALIKYLSNDRVQG